MNKYLVFAGGGKAVLIEAPTAELAKLGASEHFKMLPKGLVALAVERNGVPVGKPINLSHLKVSNPEKGS